MRISYNKWGSVTWCFYTGYYPVCKTPFDLLMSSFDTVKILHHHQCSIWLFAVTSMFKLMFTPPTNYCHIHRYFRARVHFVSANPFMLASPAALCYVTVTNSRNTISLMDALIYLRRGSVCVTGASVTESNRCHHAGQDVLPATVAGTVS